MCRRQIDAADTRQDIDMMQQLQLHITNEVGLHARPAAVFVNAASSFTSAIQIRNVTMGSDWADAKSILSLLVLGVEQGHEVELTAEGADESEAIAALGQLIRSDFALQLTPGAGV
jgi:phosphotransferase system HPr (HPr) family protein